MEVYIEANDFAPLVSLQLRVKAGSIDEQDDEAGVAHVLEHMLFKGTTKYPSSEAVAGLVESAGGEINAYTTFDHTNYYINAPSSFLFKGSELLFDMASDSLIDADELKRELEVVIEEIRRGRDNPSSVVAQNLLRHIFQGTRAARPVIGFEEIVAAFTKEKVESFYKKWYQPNNMLFVAVGDLDPDSFFQQLQLITEKVKPCTIPERQRAPFVPLLNSPVNLVRGPYEEVRLQIALQAPTLEDVSTPAWDMFASVLGHGDSSRLTRIVKDELQLVTNVDAGVYSPLYPAGMFSLSFYAPQTTALQGLEAIFEEILKLAESGPTEEEMRRVLSSVRADRIYARESMEGIGKSAGASLQTTQKLAFDDHYILALEKVTLADVKSLAGKMLEMISAGAFTVSSAMGRECLPGVTEDTIRETVLNGIGKLNKEAEAIEQAERRVRLPRNSEFNAAVKQIEIPLPFGKKLHVNYRQESRLPVVSSLLVWRGGQTQESEQKNGSSALLSHMLTRGTTRTSYKAFVNELEDYSSSISSFSTKDLFGIRMDSLSDHANRTFELMLDCIFRPAFLEDEWERVYKETKEHLIASRDSPTFRLGRLSGPLYYKDHPYSRPGQGTEESIALLSLEDLHTQWLRQFTADKFVLSVAGKFSLDEFVDRMQTSLSQFLTHAFKGEFPDRLGTQEAVRPSQSAHRVGYSAFEREQAHITLGFRSFPISDTRRTALELAANILSGQGGRLFLDLRDKRSLAYSVGASHTPMVQGGVFSTYIGTAAQKAQEAMEGLCSHIELLAKERPGHEEVERAKRAVIGTQALDAQHYSYQASQLAMSDIYDLGFDNFLRFSERVNKITPDEIQSVVADLLRENPPIVCAVGPEGTFYPEKSLEWTL
jgi:zinc protease